MNKRERAQEIYPDEELLFADGFDSAIIGVCDNRICYDKDLMVTALVEEQDFEEEEAWEYLEFNTWCAYVGEQTPLYMHTFHFKEEEVPNESSPAEDA